jgi:HSP20 family protein
MLNSVLKPNEISQQPIPKLKEGQTMISRSLFNWPAVGWSNPLLQWEQLRRDMERFGSTMFDRQELWPGAAGVFPALNLTEDKDHYYVRAELPGIKARDLELQVNGRSLSIAGERKIASEGENVKYHRREREAGRFSRIIDLPGEVNADNVNAQMTNGLLTIKIAKSEAAKPRQIAVK